MLEAFAVVTSIVFSGAMASPGQDSTRMVVQVDGFENASGRAVLRVFDSVASIAKDAPRWQRVQDFRGKSVEFTLSALPKGRWAFVAFHDKNGNGTVDHGWNRFPAEPMAFSNGFRPGILAGMPTYQKLAIPVGKPADTMRLTLHSIDMTSFFQRSSK